MRCGASIERMSDPGLGILPLWQSSLIADEPLSFHRSRVGACLSAPVGHGKPACIATSRTPHKQKAARLGAAFA